MSRILIDKPYLDAASVIENGRRHARFQASWDGLTVELRVVDAGNEPILQEFVAPIRETRAVPTAEVNL